MNFINLILKESQTLMHQIQTIILKIHLNTLALIIITGLKMII